MQVHQEKLIRHEWVAIEVPISQSEQSIVNVLIRGGDTVINSTQSLISFLKITQSEKLDQFLYYKYMKQLVDPLLSSITSIFPHFKVNIPTSIIKLNSTDSVKLENCPSIPDKVYEYTLIAIIKHMIDNYESNDTINYHYYYYTLANCMQFVDSIPHINSIIAELANKLLNVFDYNASTILTNCHRIVEQNEYIIKYRGISLYPHQKQLVNTVVNAETPTLILYTSQTGTGKTLTPLILANTHKVIFVCAAKHIGLGLAKYAISANKKIAFAYGCESRRDIRLHFNAVTKMQGQTGQKKQKIDHSLGHNVEIIISDIKSFLHAMEYMLNFEDASKLVVYWDEPTITLDYPRHKYHEYIQTIWEVNRIPLVVLSSATFPKLEDIQPTVNGFKRRFLGGNVVTVTSDYCEKSIPIIGLNGKISMPHLLSASHDYDTMQSTVRYCMSNPNVLRYLDMSEIARLFTLMPPSPEHIACLFPSVLSITMNAIKTEYLQSLLRVSVDEWRELYPRLIDTQPIHLPYNTQFDINGRQLATPSDVIGYTGIRLSTIDAHTLTGGPTIYITDNVAALSKYYIQQSNIPAVTMNDLLEKIKHNNVINAKIEELEHSLDELMNLSAEATDDKKEKGTTLNKKGTAAIINEINVIKSFIQNARLNDTFVPNKKQHLALWGGTMTSKSLPFSCSLSDTIINDILAINGVETSWKILLMMGIGVFTEQSTNIKYTEIMKMLAENQQLYLILASSDYIYGTNYQFCHGFIGKGLNLTSEKLIQSLGRIGRNTVNKTFSIRIREEETINQLFTQTESSIEAENMNRLSQGGGHHSVTR